MRDNETAQTVTTVLFLLKVSSLRYDRTFPVVVDHLAALHHPNTNWYSRSYMSHNVLWDKLVNKPVLFGSRLLLPFASFHQLSWQHSND